jgi:hypothetical protein
MNEMCRPHVVSGSKILVSLLKKGGPTKVIRTGMDAAFDEVYIQKAGTDEKLKNRIASKRMWIMNIHRCGSDSRPCN